MENRELDRSSELLSVGERIEFNHFGSIKRGPIVTVGKHGYWVRDTLGISGNSYCRCPFGNEKRLDSSE